MALPAAEGARRRSRNGTGLQLAAACGTAIMCRWHGGRVDLGGTMPELTIDLEAVEGTPIVVVRCHGDIDAHTCARLDAAMKGVIGEGVDRVIVDLADVPYSASRGLGVLIAARKQIEDAGGALVLLKPNASVTAAIKVLGFDSVFVIASEEKEAVAAALE